MNLAKKRAKVTSSLGFRINLGLLIFMLLLGLATSAIILIGFQRTEDKATSSSRKGLEAFARSTILDIAQNQAGFGDVQLNATGQLAEIAARYYVESRSGVVAPIWDGTQLALDSEGRAYDANPNRHTDLLTWDASAVPDEQRAREIEESAILDSLFPTLLFQYQARAGQEEFRPISIYFDSASGFSRFYPPVGIQAMVDLDFDAKALVADRGPEGNPARLAIWTRVYEDAAGQGLVMSRVAPVYDGDTFIGTISVDVSVARLVETVDELKPTPGGYSFYIDRAGELLRTSRAGDVEAALADPANSTFATAVSKMNEGRTGVDRVIIEGHEWFMGYAPMLSVGGSMALVAPVEEVTVSAQLVNRSIVNEGNRTLAGTLLVLVLLFGMTLVLAAWLNKRYFLAPISAMVTGTRALASGNFDAPIPFRRGDELGVLADSFNTMAGEIRDRSAALAEREEQYRGIFESTNDGIAITSVEGRLVEVNPAMCRMHGYSREEFLALPPGTHIHPDYRTQRSGVLEGIRNGIPYRIRGRAVRKDGTEIDTEVLGTPLMYRGELHVLSVVRDITEQVQDEKVLEAAVAERTRELSTLLDVSASLASTLDLEPLLGIVLEQLESLFDYADASILISEADHYRLLETREKGFGVNPEMRGRKFPLRGLLVERHTSREPLIIPDITSDEDPMAESYREAVGFRRGTRTGWIRSVMSAPLETPDRVIGFLEISSHRVGAFDTHSIELAAIIANQAAAVIENARLYTESSKRAREMESLASVSAALSFRRPLPELMDELSATALSATNAVACAITVVEDGRSSLVGQAGLPEGYPEATQRALDRPGMMAARLLLNQGRVIFQRNYKEFLRTTPEFEPMREYIPQLEWDAIAFVPMVLRGEVIGSLNFYYRAETEVDADEQRFLEAIASQAATVVENIRLYSQGQSLAVLEERQRISRELHDSVSQALYGIALGARTARELLDRDPAKSAEPLDFVLSLAEAGIAEMRALIFELRPEALAEEGLVAALGKQAAALRARHQIAVTTAFTIEPEVPFATKEALFRICQESFNNIVKHAGATEVSLAMKSDAEFLELTIHDNGRGFDPTGEFPGHLGLKSMRERAAQMGGSVEHRSASGEGTTVVARFPVGVARQPTNL